MRIAAITVACFLFAPAAAVVAADAGEELTAALKKASNWESYRFTVESRPGPGTGGEVEVRYQKGQPFACKAERIECFKKGDAVVYLDAGKWMRSRRGTLSDPLRVLGALAKVNAVRLPHEEATTLVKVLRGVKKEDKKDSGQTVYNADLDADAARALVGTEHKSVARGGTARFWVGEGGLAKYEITVRIQGRIGNADVDGKVTRIVTLSGAGTTKVAVPEAARKALE